MKGVGQALPRHGLRIAQRVRLVSALRCATAHIAQHRARLDRCQLVLVTQQHQSGCGRQRLQQGIHHFQVHHRGLVHDEHIHIERVGRVVAKLSGVGPRTQQRVQGAGRANALDQRVQIECGRCAFASLALEGLERAVNRLLEPRCRFAGGRGQGHAQGAGAIVQGQQQRQQARSGVGFARTRAAGDDRQMRSQGHRTGPLLPIGWCLGRIARRRGFGKKPVQPLACQHLGHRERALCPLQQALAHPLFVGAVAAQIQQRRIGRAAQHQGLPQVWRIGQAQASRRGRLQGRQPSGRVLRHVGPQGE